MGIGRIICAQPDAYLLNSYALCAAVAVELEFTIRTRFCAAVAVHSLRKAKKNNLVPSRRDLRLTPNLDVRFCVAALSVAASGHQRFRSQMAFTSNVEFVKTPLE